MSFKDFVTHNTPPENIWKYRNKVNNSKNPIIRNFYKAKYYKIMTRYNASIPLETEIAELPYFPHHINGVFISVGAKIGKKCVIFHQVTIGSNTLADSKGKGAPIIGNNVFIGCGAKIIGGVKIGDNARIGANCVVTKDVPPNSTVVSSPVRVIEHSGTLDNSFLGFNESRL